MSRTLVMMAAPVAMQPGGYVSQAYRDRNTPTTTTVTLDSVRRGDAWRISLRWAAPRPVRAAGDDPRAFVDAAALLTPRHRDAAWMTMGAPGAEVEGVLWRADKAELWRIRAAGLGSVVRQSPPADWRAEAAYDAGVWHVTWLLMWPTLTVAGKVGVAIWQGAQGERAGLKSVSAGWLELDV